MPRNAGRDGPDPIDLHIGAEVAARRKALGRNQSELGRALGLTFQQVQKYEKGTNRMSGSMLYRAALFLGCKPADLFPAIDGPDAASAEVSACTRLGAVTGGHDLARAYLDMTQPQRNSVLTIASVIVDARRAA